MNGASRLLVGACWLVASSAGSSVIAYAEPNGITIVGPPPDSTTTRGTAGFDSTGIEATSRSETSRPATGAAAAPGAGSDLFFRPIPFNQVPAGAIVTNGGVITNNAIGTRPACPPGQTGFFASDTAGNAQGIVCVSDQAAAPPRQPGDPAVQLAEEASARQPWSDLRVSANPDVGLTGLPSWFWCAGSAAMPDATASAGPLTVTVRATMADVTWDFGDGERLLGDLGRPFPQPSGVRHVYETDSSNRPQGYAVTASVRWRVTFSVNGGPFADLGFKTRDYISPYAVRQLQPEATP